MRGAAIGFCWAVVFAAATLPWAEPVGASVSSAGFDHTRFDRVLKAHVRAGRVDYAAIARGAARRTLDRYVVALAQADPSSMARDARLAFWLNAYNALVIKAIVDRYPVASVMGVPGFFNRLEYRVGRRRLTLDAIEKVVIRRQFKDPRVHFALVCGARSCPPLPAHAFRPATVDRQLDRLARDFIRSGAGVQLRGDRIYVSKLFDWYAAEFRGRFGSVQAYLARYHARHAARLRRPERLWHLDYDWRLNSK